MDSEVATLSSCLSERMHRSESQRGLAAVCEDALTSLFLREGFVCYPVLSYLRIDRGELGGDLLKSGRILKA